MSVTPLLLLGAVSSTHWIDKKLEYVSSGTSPKVDSGPWGDLQTWNIRLEQPAARERLFTSPLSPNDTEKSPDCHWTALNYFKAPPDPKMSDNDYASRYIQENYYEIAKPGLAGDLVLLLNQQNQVLHSSVYIAADVVFTKNGVNYAQPWILMREKDMLGNFSQSDPVKVVCMRRRGK